MIGLIEHPYPQGTIEWRQARKGVITASRAKDARDFDKSGKPSAKRLGYAMDLARERCGGEAAEVYVNAAMRKGSEEEAFAAIEYVAKTGARIDEAYFITTPDRKFGISLDRWVGADRKSALEIKTMVSSATLFKAIVGEDISEYRDQCVFAIWLLVLDWVDLCLWCPDLQRLHVIRIHRDEAEVQRMEDDMVKFESVVSGYEMRLREKLGIRQTETPPWDEAAEPSTALSPATSPAPRQTVELADPDF